ncbi:hypothetical protein Cgig2_029728 [Carnegiea gigantea]|uniref:Uncharacterized protein n=1 Tax=Carnegiea gigantea TaxID=171969 RepID=A0A9Q1GJM2_9CARY|nr:hypothetical protein Cgig2_029728 [Carnegiea gigantea]
MEVNNHNPNTYASLVNPEEGTALKFIPMTEVNGRQCAKIKKADVQSEVNYWENVVLCGVMVSNPPFKMLGYEEEVCRWKTTNRKESRVTNRDNRKCKETEERSPQVEETGGTKGFITPRRRSGRLNEQPKETYVAPGLARKQLDRVQEELHDNPMDETLIAQERERRIKGAQPITNGNGGSLNGQYTAKSGYQWHLNLSDKANWASLTWSGLTIPRHCIIAWVMMRQ